MRILIVLTYFQPHKSGLTVYAVRQAIALAARGHRVTVLTSRYVPDLPEEEWIEGVRVVRVPVAFRLSKGVIMPGMPGKAWQLIGDADIVNLHVPQVDAALVAFLARLRRRPVVLTYHCDLRMPAGFINALAGWAAHLANRVSAWLADVIVHNTLDFAEHSPFLSAYLDKLAVVQPPIVVDPVTEEDRTVFREKLGLKLGQPVIGMVARLATEKGVEYLVEAMPDVLAEIPDARVVFVGEFQNVFGEEAYREKLLPLIQELGDHWTFMGVVSELEKAVFFHVCDVLVLPSLNSTESFGMVQVEAMTCGTLVVATDLPGVRQPVKTTGMGRIVPIRDSGALADEIIELLRTDLEPSPEKVSELTHFYAPETIAEIYEALYRSLVEADE
jgi:glycosyltransferase involved in cell wall biosynthesis